MQVCKIPNVTLNRKVFGTISLRNFRSLTQIETLQKALVRIGLFQRIGSVLFAVATRLQWVLFENMVKTKDMQDGIVITMDMYVIGVSLDLGMQIRKQKVNGVYA